MNYFFTLLLAIHGAIHLLGFIKAFGLAEISQLKMPVSRLYGILWLDTFLLFGVVTALFWMDSFYWVYSGAAAIVFSQTLIVKFWSDAKAGTVANLIIAAFIIREVFF